MHSQCFFFNANRGMVCLAQTIRRGRTSPRTFCRTWSWARVRHMRSATGWIEEWIRWDTVITRWWFPPKWMVYNGKPY